MSDPKLPVLPNGEVDWERLVLFDSRASVYVERTETCWSALALAKEVAAHYRALGAKGEREACAKVAHEHACSDITGLTIGPNSNPLAVANEFKKWTAYEIAAAIHRRGEQS